MLITENLAMKLKKMQYEVIDIVSSGKNALKQVEKRIPYLILMDIAIKGNIDGIQTAKKIRQKHDIPIVFLTAYADDRTLDRASKTGCYGYILKPFKERELHATITMALKKHQEQNEIQQSLQAKVKQYASECGPANIDRLTQLPNRLALPNLFEYILSQSENSSSNRNTESNLPTVGNTNRDLLAVLYLEIDRFQRIFKSLSDESRDLLITVIADCITSTLNKHDSVTATIKLQDSQFAVLVAGVEREREAKELAAKILGQFRKSFIVDNVEFFLTASIGIAFYPFSDTEPEQLLQQAYQAMESALSKGGDRCEVYNSSLQRVASIEHENLSLETALHYALERQQLEVYYQPKVELKTGKIVGAEALVRWNYPELGLIMPDRFIAIAEQSSLIESIGEWVLATACERAYSWHQSGFNDFSIAVNLSGRQFKQLDLFHKLTQILFDSNLQPQFLELELTEKILVENEKLNIQRLNLIKKLDIQISLDDFGTGYSSLGYLQQFPFDVLKIDRCFVSKIDRNRKNAVITKSMIEMAHQLGLKVVAEGVETKSELAFLIDCQCDLVQGYLFGRPLPVKEFERLLFSDKRFDTTNLKLQPAEL